MEVKNRQRTSAASAGITGGGADRGNPQAGGRRQDDPKERGACAGIEFTGRLISA
jgi:hypothetical protein